MQDRRFLSFPNWVKAAAALCVFGCQAEKFAPDQVAMGVSRLTVRNVGTLTSLISDDKSCGFASEGVINGAEVRGEWGQVGEVVFHVESCTLDFGDDTLAMTDCNGVERRVGGRVTVSG